MLLFQPGVQQVQGLGLERGGLLKGLLEQVTCSLELATTLTDTESAQTPSPSITTQENTERKKSTELNQERKRA